MALHYFTTEWNSFASCVAARSAADPSPALSIERPIQAFLDLIFCSFQERNAFAAVTLILLFFAVTTYIVSRINGNYSQVDRLWSIIPVIVAWTYVFCAKESTTPAAGEWNARRLFAWCVTAWGVRMTFNFYRRGGYGKGHEDYRWVYVRKFWFLQNAIVWELFVFFFISLYQVFIICAQTLPLLSIPAPATATGKHIFLAGLFLSVLAMELIADEQQWQFQEGKYGKAPKKPHLALDYKRGFLTHGLFAVSRKPNVVCEQSMWVVIYLVSVQQGWGLLNVSCVGALLLILLTFQAANFTESITGSKYPAYAAYQKMTPMLLPSRFGARYANEPKSE